LFPTLGAGRTVHGKSHGAHGHDSLTALRLSRFIRGALRHLSDPPFDRGLDSLYSWDVRARPTRPGRSPPDNLWKWSR
jgi:hypothetical protein